MNLVLIDSSEPTVKVVEINGNDEQAGNEIRKLIGCKMLEVVNLGGVVDMWIDEEYWFNKKQGLNQGFMLPDMPNPFLGNAVVAMCGKEGEIVGFSKDASESMQGLITQAIEFVEVEYE